jgi:hypothetical protein
MVLHIKECKSFSTGIESIVLKAFAERSFTLNKLHGNFHAHICERSQNN